ncbi:uncharacterized protein FFE2_05497 [Fusarium fujikuroi]|nr:uncharacterized protein FFE2_05497 [Fusarium fujikuroi]
MRWCIAIDVFACASFDPSEELEQSVDEANAPNNSSQLVQFKPDPPTCKSGKMATTQVYKGPDLQVRKSTYWVLDYGYALVLTAPYQHHPIGTAFWLCKICDTKGDFKDGLYNFSQASSSCNKHLKVAHRIIRAIGSSEQPISPSPQPSSQLSVLQAFQNTPPVPLVASSVESFRDGLLDWIVTAAIPLNVVTHTHFRSLLLTPPEIIKAALPKSGTTVQNWLLTRYNEKRGLLAEELLAASSLISLSFDLWTSPNGYTILGVLAHYITVAGFPTHKVIAFRKLEGAHSGENQAVIIDDVCRTFNLPSHKLGFFTLDNIESNTTCLTALFRRQPSHFLSYPINEQVQIRRLRCWGHIINLVAKALLLTPRLLTQSTPDHTNDYEESWRALGAIGKLHNIVQFTRKTPQRRELWSRCVHEAREMEDATSFDDISPHIQLRPDQQTRWNSTSIMIDRALRLQTVIDQFCIRSLDDPEPSKRISERDILYPDDWAYLRQIAGILRPFKEETKKLEGHKEATISFVIYSYKKLYQHLCDHYSILFTAAALPSSSNPSPPNPPPFYSSVMDQALPPQATNSQACEAITNAVNKLYTYGKKITSSPVYWAAIILHPSMRLKFLAYLINDEIKVEAIRTRFEAFYAENWEVRDPQSPQSPAVQDTVSQPDEIDGIPTAFYTKQARPYGMPVTELSRYLTEEVKQISCGPIEWWRQYEHTYPTLSKMAYDILCINVTA